MFVYAKENGTLKLYTPTGGETIPQSAVWIDLLHVTPEEEASALASRPARTCTP